MDKRTRILAIIFGAAMAYAGLSSVAYPRWIKPLLTLDERVTSATSRLAR